MRTFPSSRFRMNVALLGQEWPDAAGSTRLTRCTDRHRQRLPCIERSGALPSVPRRRWPTLIASCGQVQFSDLCAQGRSVAASLRYRLLRAGKGHHRGWLGPGKRRSRSRRFRGRIRLARVYSILKKDGYNVRAEPMCSMLCARQPRLCTIWTAVAPEPVVTRRTNTPTPRGYPPPRRTLVTTSKPYRDSTIHSRRSVSLELSLETQFFREADRLLLRRADQAAMDLELFPRPHIRGAP